MEDPGRAVERGRRARLLKGTASRRPAAGPDGLRLESLRAPPGLAFTFRGREVKQKTQPPEGPEHTEHPGGQAMTANTQCRDDQVGTFFLTHAGRLERAVRRHVNHVGGELIEDACQMAWTTLLQRPDITLDTRGFGWLSTVAVHEAWRLASTAHEQPAGALTSPADHKNEPGERPEPADSDQSGTAEKALDHIEHHDRLQAMRALKPRQREALYAGRGGYSSSRGPNWPSVGSAQQNHGSVSRGLPSVEPARIGSARPAGGGDRPAAWSAPARTLADVSGVGSGAPPPRLASAPRGGRGGGAAGGD